MQHFISYLWVRHPASEDPSLSLIKDNHTQTMILTGQTTQASGILRTWLLSPFPDPKNSPWVVCFPFQHAGPHYLIGCCWLAANWIGCRYSSSLMIGPIWRPISIRVVAGQESISPAVGLEWSSPQEGQSSLSRALTSCELEESFNPQPKHMRTSGVCVSTQDCP